MVAAGLLALYIPTLNDLFRGLWGVTEQGQGPIVLGVSIFLMYRQWPEMVRAGMQSRPHWAGWVLVVIGLLLYVLGRSQDILLFEVGSVIWMLCGLALLFVGPVGLKVQWFPLLFLIFIVPLPGPIVDALTMPMKMAVSYVVDQVLFAAGYPIARTGVVLQIGPYHLLVADACAGLHTLFSLEAMGLLYLNLVKRDSLMRNLALAILVVPISFAANIVRVMSLTLVTYYFGDEAGQGFLHDFAGLVLYISALLLIVAADAILHKVSAVGCVNHLRR